MLTRRRCPHTGIVNFFSDPDPFVSFGSIVEVGVPAYFEWRCYLGDEAASGIADDARTAGRCLMSQYRKVVRTARQRAAAASGRSGSRSAHALLLSLGPNP
jgi:hypothetical protein